MRSGNVRRATSSTQSISFWLRTLGTPCTGAAWACIATPPVAAGWHGAPRCRLGMKPRLSQNGSARVIDPGHEERFRAVRPPGEQGVRRLQGRQDFAERGDDLVDLRALDDE